MKIREATIEDHKNKQGTIGGFSPRLRAAKGPFVGPCDIGFMASVSSGTDAIAVDFEVLKIEDGY